MNSLGEQIKTKAFSIYSSLLPFRVKESIYQNTKLKVYKNGRKYEDGDKIIKSFDKYRCIFVHIPKTGGISIKRSLFNCYSPLPHFGVRDYQLIFGKEIFNEYFKFAFVRNPWSRVLSAYIYLKGIGCTKRDRQWSEINLRKYDNFNDFVLGWLSKKNIYSQIHFVPQSEFITDHQGNIQVDHIAHLENMTTEFEYLRTKINPKATLQHLNKSNKNKNHSKISYQEFYNLETKEKVADLYHTDINNFNYEFAQK